MSRRPRADMKTNYFHIMAQGINKSYIFENKVNKERYIKLINDSSPEYNIEVLSYCIMDNHVHILIKTSEVEKMSEFMKNINLRYSMYYNKKYNRVGYVFRDRFKSQGIFSEEQLLKCVRYILNNPVKAKICEKTDEYKFSYCQSDFAYIHKAKDISLFEEEFIDIKDDLQDDKQILNEYINYFGLNIKDNTDDYKRLVKYLKRRNMSFSRISNVMGISIYKVRKICSSD